MLFTGDIEAEVEQTILEHYGDRLSSVVLKSPHHGSNSSSTMEFLDAVNPQIIVIQVGRDNSFGHPHARVLRRYRNQAPLIYRNDEHGKISLQSDGQTVWKNNPRFPVFPQLFGSNLETVYTIGTSN
jgi:competence protein ComEC